MAKTLRKMSPYKRYEKTPVVFSQDLKGWRAAVKRGDPDAIEEHDLAWRQRFGVPRKTTEEECR